MGFLSILQTVDSVFSKTMRWFLISVMTIIPIICGLDVIFRYIIKAPLHGSDEILILLQIWLYFVGVVSAGRERTHITARVLESAIKTNEGIARLRALVAVLASIVSFYMVYLGYGYFTYASRVQKTTSILNYPMVWYEYAPFFCFIPLAIYTVAEVFYYLKHVKHATENFKTQDEEIDEIMKELEEQKKLDNQSTAGGKA